MTINNINNTTEAEVLPSIAKKIKKPKGDFSAFLQNLGKTDKPKKDSAQNTSILNKNIAKKPESKINSPLVSNLLNNDSKKINKPSIQTVQSTQNNGTQNVKLQNTKFEGQNEPQKNQNQIEKNKSNNDIQNIPQNKTKADILNALLQNKPSDNTKPTNPIKSDIKKVALSENEALPNNPNNNLNSLENNAIGEDSPSLSKSIPNTTNISNVPNTTPEQNNVKNTEIESKIPAQDSPKIADSNILNPINNLNNLNAPIPANNKDEPLDSATSPKNVGQFSILNDEDIKLPIKDTLKYGAFKAFDALSLLKPSDGKKLSDLIKKADELALNLTKMSLQTKKESTPLNNKISENLDLKNNNLKNQIDNSKTPQTQENTTNPIKENMAKNTLSPESTNKEIAETKPQNENKTDTTKNESKNNNQVANKDILKDTLNGDSKDSKQDSPQKQAHNNQTKPESTKEALNNPQNMPDTKMQEDLKPVSFKQNEKKEIKNSDEIKQNSTEKTTDSTNANNIKNEQLQKTFDIKETMRSFVTQLRQEIVNYKPPLSKITLELNPANLGSVEVSITHQGKNIQVQLNANQNTINLFIQNQSDLRAALSQIGYENITMSFSNGSQMGFSDNKGNWNYQNIAKDVNVNNDDSSEFDIANMDITIINNYA